MESWTIKFTNLWMEFTNSWMEFTNSWMYFTNSWIYSWIHGWSLWPTIIRINYGLHSGELSNTIKMFSWIRSHTHTHTRCRHVVVDVTVFASVIHLVIVRWQRVWSCRGSNRCKCTWLVAKMAMDYGSGVGKQRNLLQQKRRDFWRALDWRKKSVDSCAECSGLKVGAIDWPVLVIGDGVEAVSDPEKQQKEE